MDNTIKFATLAEQNFSTECAFNYVVSYGILWRALLRSGLNWRMHPAQLHGMQHLSTRPEARDNEIGEMLVDITFLGIPVQLDKDMHEGFIELRHNDKILHRIESLAVPIGF